jgi:hypothetical protein
MFGKFHFKNFEPDLDTRISAEEVLDHLERSLPPTSTVVGMIEQIKGEYRATLEVYTVTGIFTVAAQHPKPETSLWKAKTRMRIKLEKWRKSQLHPLNAPIFKSRQSGSNSTKR